MLTINEIETIVHAFCTHDIQDTDLNHIILNQLLKQTNLESIEEVRKILSLYKDTKSEWLKKGLENVLLHGEFPVVIKEVINSTMPSVSTQFVDWPEHPYITYKTYCYEPKQESISLKKTNIDI